MCEQPNMFKQIAKRNHKEHGQKKRPAFNGNQIPVFGNKGNEKEKKKRRTIPALYVVFIREFRLLLFGFFFSHFSLSIFRQAKYSSTYTRTESKLN